MENTNNIWEGRSPIGRRNIMCMLRKLLGIYMFCGIGGFLIETVWCWIDFQKFTSRTSNLFFPISCVWGIGGIVLYLLTKRNRWNKCGYIFLKCMVLGTLYEFLCGYFGEKMFGVTFWDYSGFPLHIGKYINVPFCLVWGLLGVLWVKKIYPAIKNNIKVLDRNGKKIWLNILMLFMILSQLFTGMALLRMYERQNGIAAKNGIERMMDVYFTDQLLQKFFPKMKNAVTGEKIYILSEQAEN